MLLYPFFLLFQSTSFILPLCFDHFFQSIAHASYRVIYCYLLSLSSKPLFITVSNLCLIT